MRVLEAQSGLKVLVGEAVQALATLDTEKLEELAMSCQALNSELGQTVSPAAARKAHEATEDMAALAHVLEATRANLDVMNRLREFHARRMEYSVVERAALHGTEALDGVR